MRGRRDALLPAGMLVLLLSACGNEPPAGIVVLGAASLAEALEAVADAHETATGTPVAVRFGGSGWVAREIREGAPADVFISAHPALVTSLITDGLADSASVREVAANRLVVVVPADDPVPGTGWPDALRDRRIALGEPETVPAGTYAREVLAHLGLWAASAAATVFTPDVRTALAMVEQRAVDAGFVYRSDALRSERARVAWIVPDSLHTAIRYTAVVFPGGGHPVEAAAFLDSLRTGASRDTLLGYGFEAP